MFARSGISFLTKLTELLDFATLEKAMYRLHKRGALNLLHLIVAERRVIERQLGSTQ